jgi:hypothetical protein
MPSWTDQSSVSVRSERRSASCGSAKRSASCHFYSQNGKRERTGIRSLLSSDHIQHGTNIRQQLFDLRVAAPPLRFSISESPTAPSIRFLCLSNIPGAPYRSGLARRCVSRHNLLRADRQSGTPTALQFAYRRSEPANASLQRRLVALAEARSWPYQSLLQARAAAAHQTRSVR